MNDTLRNMAENQWGEDKVRGRVRGGVRVRVGVRVR